MGGDGPAEYNKFFGRLAVDNLNGKTDKSIEVIGNAKMLLDSLGGKENVVAFEAKYNPPEKGAPATVTIKGLEGYNFPVKESPNGDKKIDNIQAGTEFITKKVPDSNMPKLIEKAKTNINVELPQAAKTNQGTPMAH